MKNLLFLSLIILLSSCASAPIDGAKWAAFDGRHQEAIDIFEKETNNNIENWKKIGQEGGIPGSAYFYIWMPGICDSYFSLRQFSKAQECNESVKSKTFTVIEDDPMGDTWHSSSARSYRARYYYLKSAIELEFGNFRDSYEHGEKAITFNRRDLDEPESQLIGMKESAKLMANTAIAAGQLGKKKRALELIELIEELEVKFGDVETNRDILYKNAARARAYLALGAYDKAKKALFFKSSAATVIARASVAFMTLGFSELTFIGKMGDSDFNVNNYFMLAKICFEQGDYDCAKPYYDSLINNNFDTELGYLPEEIKKDIELKAELSNRPALHYIVLYDRGVIAKYNGNQELALKYFKQAINIIELQRASINTEASKIGFVGNKEDLYRDIVALLIETKQFEEAFLYAERAKARALVDMLASKQSLGKLKVNQNTSQLISSITSVEKQFIDLNIKTSDKQRSVDRALLRKKQKSLRSQQPELASLMTVSEPKLSELQALLPENDTLLEYYGDEEQLFVFVLSRTSVGAIKLKATKLTADISEFRSAISDPSDGTYVHLASNLYKRLISPIVSNITTENITIVPHGSLHYLPFNALMSNNQYFIDQFNLRILPSASVMKFINKKVSATNDLFVMGNPDVGDPKFDLPGAQQEAQIVVKGVKNSTLLLRKQATETAVKNNAGQYKRLHFATHGIFDEFSPLASGLLLASDESNDGILTVGELYDLELNAELVTLSACETALGSVANGDDVVGFTRGFLYAGTNSIVSSLWKVDDAATSQLMQLFYKNMKNTTKRSSLRSAQLTIKKNYKHPYYWAAFQLTGSER